MPMNEDETRTVTNLRNAFAKDEHHKLDDYHDRQIVEAWDKFVGSEYYPDLTKFHYALPERDEQAVRVERITKMLRKLRGDLDPKLRQPHIQQFGSVFKENKPYTYPTEIIDDLRDALQVLQDFFDPPAKDMYADPPQFSQAENGDLGAARRPFPRQTHTFALLGVPGEFHKLVGEKLLAAGYEHAISQDGDKTVLDMHGIALIVE